MLSFTGSVHRIVKVAGVQTEAVDRFAYLGSTIAAGDGTDMDIENRINKARAAFAMLSVQDCPYSTHPCFFLKNQRKQVRTNIGLADTLIPSSFLYSIYMGGTGPCELMTIIFRRVIKS